MSIHSCSIKYVCVLFIVQHLDENERQKKNKRRQKKHIITIDMPFKLMMEMFLPNCNIRAHFELM